MTLVTSKLFRPKSDYRAIKYVSNELGRYLMCVTGATLLRSFQAGAKAEERARARAGQACVHLIGRQSQVVTRCVRPGLHLQRIWDTPSRRKPRHTVGVRIPLILVPAPITRMSMIGLENRAAQHPMHACGS